MVLVCFWYGFGMDVMVCAWFCCGFGLVLVWFCYGFGIVLAWFWYAFGMELMVLAWFWYVFNMVLVWIWWFGHGFGMVLVWFWYGFGMVLIWIWWFWHGFGMFFYGFWTFEVVADVSKMCLVVAWLCEAMIWWSGAWVCIGFCIVLFEACLADGFWTELMVPKKKSISEKTPFALYKIAILTHQSAGAENFHIF